eukprot:7777918-Pyramimonas_sp.AAC.1
MRTGAALPRAPHAEHHPPSIGKPPARVSERMRAALGQEPRVENGPPSKRRQCVASCRIRGLQEQVYMKRPARPTVASRGATCLGNGRARHGESICKRCFMFQYPKYNTVRKTRK